MMSLRQIISREHQKNALSLAFLLIPVLVSITYMHIRISSITEMSLFCEWRFLRAIISILFDTLAIGLLSHMVCLRKRLPSYILASTFSLIWTYVNIIYATYFSTYLPLSMVQEASNLSDLPMPTYIANALSVWDVVPLLFTISIPLLFNTKKNPIWKKAKSDTRNLVLPLICILVYFIGLKLFIFENHITFPNKKTIAQVSLMPTESRLNLNSALTIYETGIIRGQILPFFFYAVFIPLIEAYFLNNI